MLYPYDLGTMWPYDTALGGVVGFIAIVGVPTAPFISVGVAMWSLFMVWTWWRTLTVLEIVLYAAALRGRGRVHRLAGHTAGGNQLLMWFWD